MGFSYSNQIRDSNYANDITISSEGIAYQTLAGNLKITDLSFSNKAIYRRQEEIARILNYDQLIMKTQGRRAVGRLHYENDTGQKVFTPALINSFTFGEIIDDGLLEIPVSIVFDRGKTWINETPIITRISLQGSDESHIHPYSHPWTHGKVETAGNGRISRVGGTDLAMTVITVNGYMAPFTLHLKNTKTGDIRSIVYNNTVGNNKALVINNMERYVYLDGMSAIGDFDLIRGDSPFFDLMPNSDYEISFESEVIDGDVLIEIYETWVSAP